MGEALPHAEQLLASRLFSSVQVGQDQEDDGGRFLCLVEIADTDDDDAPGVLVVFSNFRRRASRSLVIDGGGFLDIADIDIVDIGLGGLVAFGVECGILLLC